MSMTVIFGWWVIPLAITLGTISWAVLTPGEPMRGDYSFPDPMPFVRFVGALIASLVAWLIWALVT